MPSGSDWPGYLRGQLGRAAADERLRKFQHSSHASRGAQDVAPSRGESLQRSGRATAMLEIAHGGVARTFRFPRQQPPVVSGDHAGSVRRAVQVIDPVSHLP
jgi:hypothetical protein